MKTMEKIRTRDIVAMVFSGLGFALFFVSQENDRDTKKIRQFFPET